MLAELFAIVAPIFACAALGFAWARLGGRFDTESVTTLIMNLGAPCLVFSSLARLEVDAAALGRMAGAAVASLAAFLAVASLVLGAAGLPRHTFLSPMVFANAGNMGMPICLFAFGSEGLALAVCYFAVSAIGQFTLGVALWSGRVSLRQLAATPLVYGAVLGAVVAGAGLPVPAWILDTTGLLGQVAIPLMLLTLGVSLARLRARGLSRAVGLSALRLGMGAAVGFGLAALLGFEGAARGVLVVECAMPVAVFNSVLAERFGRSPQEVAGLVLLSTLLSVGTTPLLLALLL